MPSLRIKTRSVVGLLLLLLILALCVGCQHVRGGATNGLTPAATSANPPDEDRISFNDVDETLPEVSEDRPSPPLLRSEGLPPSIDTDERPPYFNPSNDRVAAEIYPAVWGLAGLRGYLYGEQVAPNGREYTPIFSGEWHFNFWLWREQGFYGFTNSTFWGQKAGLGITNPSQGIFDFSKREFDLEGGLAWNYSGRFEARIFAYSFNNLNRGSSPIVSRGYTDGVGLENRYYLCSTYDLLGTAEFDLARATFVSMGYYPTKDMMDFQNRYFFPSLFARAYLTYDLDGERCYLYSDMSLVSKQPVFPKMLEVDAGIAYRPFRKPKGWEFRLGANEKMDLQNKEVESQIYWSARIIY